MTQVVVGGHRLNSYRGHVECFACDASIMNESGSKWQMWERRGASKTVSIHLIRPDARSFYPPFMEKTKRLSGLRSPPLFSAVVGNEILPQVALTRVRHTSCLDRLRVFFEMGTVDGKVPSFSIVQGKGFLI